MSREFHTPIQQDTTQQRNQPPFTDPLLNNRRQGEKHHVRHVHGGSRRAIITLDVPFEMTLDLKKCHLLKQHVISPPEIQH